MALTQKRVFAVFEEAMDVAASALEEYTRNQPLKIIQKADRTLATSADIYIDSKVFFSLVPLGLPVVSEEGSQAFEGRMPFRFNTYAVGPGNGITVLYGKEFGWVGKKLCK